MDQAWYHPAEGRAGRMSGTKLRDITKVVKATEEVPIRTTIPDGEDDPATKKGIIYPGFEVQIAEEWQGQEVEGNNLWYRDKNGDFYWSGWFWELAEEQEPVIELDESSVLPWWLSNYNIREIWDEGYMGEGVKVAVLDTGLDPEHPNLRHAISTEDSFNFLDRNKNIKDWNGHGTHCTGIIAANGSNNVWGISPKATIVGGKITRSVTSGINLDVLADSIEYFSDKVHVISISAGVAKINKRLREAIDNCSNAIIVAAIGNSETRRKGDYPAEHDSVLAVGAIDELENITDYTIRSDSIGVCAPGHEIYSTDKDGSYKTDSGTSMAAPFVAGLIALAKSKSPEKNMHEISDLLIETGTEKISGSFTYKTINPVKFMERI
ncbi:MAG: S8 family serine peptidase [Balneolaceae bacterium]